MLRLLLHEPDYTDQLAAFLRSVGQQPLVSGPGRIEVEAQAEELEAYLKVWQVIHPDAIVELRS
jgi:hypothetical protein